MAVHDNPPHQPFPDYTQMIMGAIGKGGASKEAITDYIEANYADLPPAHVTHVTHTLEKLRQTGQLVLLKDDHYVINASAHHMDDDDNNDDDDGDDDDNNEDSLTAHNNGVGLSQPIKRGRGRPPKPKSALPAGVVPSSPRPRGRPPKPRDPLAPNKPSKPPSSGRPRGRPRKSPQVGAGSGPGPGPAVGGVKRGRGRPRKS